MQGCTPITGPKKKKKKNTNLQNEQTDILDKFSHFD